MQPYSLNIHPEKEIIQRIWQAALAAVDPYQAVCNSLARDGNQLTISRRVYDLTHFQRVFVVGAGKAAYPMARATEEILGKHIHQGLVVTKQGHIPENSTLKKIEIMEAGHPVPDERGVSAAKKISQLLTAAKHDDLVICLISGGGSALMTDPAPEVDLADLQTLTTQLLGCGAPIEEVNTIRKHLDQVKGGNLARMAAPAVMITLILSDVVGDPLEIIASGPTVPDPSTFADALQILQRYPIENQVPLSVQSWLQKGLKAEINETPKPDDPLFKQVFNHIIASNYQAASAAATQASAEGLHTLLLTTSLQGEARCAGGMICAIARQIEATRQPLPRPACLILGGETTVTLHGDGKGGRNQELALSCVKGLAGLPNILFLTLATDGGDGPTDAAGAVVSGETQWRAHQMGLDPSAFLARNDSYHFFNALGDLLRTGPTQTNVNDLAFLFAF